MYLIPRGPQYILVATVSQPLDLGMDVVLTLATVPLLFLQVQPRPLSTPSR